MLTNIQLPTCDQSTPSQPKNLRDRSFHMDRGKIVCNGCSGHFPNLVLFENHIHSDIDDITSEANKPSKKSGPKTVHKTFNNMSHEEMMKDFHKMDELKGCYYTNSQFICCMCGKGFSNPYILFSHKIIHPASMKPLRNRQPPGIKTQTPKVVQVRPRKTDQVISPPLVKVVTPKIYADQDSEEEESSCPYDWQAESRMPKVTKAFVVSKEDDIVDHGDLPVAFAEPQNMVQVPWVPVDKLSKSQAGEKGQKGRTYVYRMLPKGKSELYSVMKVAASQKKAATIMPENFVVVKPEDAKSEKPVTNPGIEKGLVFTDLDEEKMNKVFKSLPGLQKCTVTKEGVYKCDKCLKSFENPYLLFTHRMLHGEMLGEESMGTDMTDPSSQGAQLVFYSLPGLNKCKFFNGKYHCDVCKEKFSNPYLLFTHKMSHDPTDEKNNETGIIQIKENSDFGNIFGENGLQRCKIKRGKYFCDKCSFYFKNPYLLLNHKLLHQKKDGNIFEKVTETVKTVSSGQQTDDLDSFDSKDDESDESDFCNSDPESEEDVCYECNLCQLQFETLEGLSLHIESHTMNSDDKTDDLDKSDDLDDKTDDLDDKADDLDMKQETDAGSLQNKSKRPASDLEDETIPGPSTSKLIKTEPIHPYPMETTVVQPKPAEPPHRIKIKVALAPPKVNVSVPNVTIKSEPDSERSLLKVKLPWRHKIPQMKQAVVRLVRLDIKPNQVCILK